MSIKKYDKNGNLIYSKDTYGLETWHHYDESNNKIYYKDAVGEIWKEFDENNNLIHYKDSYNHEFWCKWDFPDEKIEITYQEFKQIERRKLLLNNKRCSRFEIMDI